LRKTRNAYSVCAQAAMMLWTCNVTDKLLVNVTPRSLIVCTFWSLHSVQEALPNFLRRPTRVDNKSENADITQSQAANHH